MFRDLIRRFRYSQDPRQVRPPQVEKPRLDISQWQPKYPNLQLNLAAKIHPKLRHAIQNNTIHSVIQTIGPDLYRLPVFTPEALTQFDAEIKQLLNWIKINNVQMQVPNSMNEYGLILSHIGFQRQMNLLLATTIVPLATELFPEVGGASLDAQHAFVVDYGIAGDSDLGFHVDNSEVTLNLCLGGHFRGSNLYFQGRRCPEHRQTPHQTTEHIEVEHQVGMAILHAGAHRHGVYPIEQGERRSLIMWCSSETYRAQTTTCPDWCLHTILLHLLVELP